MGCFLDPRIESEDDGRGEHVDPPVKPEDDEEEGRHSREGGNPGDDGRGDDEKGC